MVLALAKNQGSKHIKGLGQGECGVVEDLSRGGVWGS